MENYFIELKNGGRNKTQKIQLFLFPSRLRSENLRANPGVEVHRSPLGNATFKKKRLLLKIEPRKPDTFPVKKINAELKRCSLAIRKMKI